MTCGYYEVLPVYNGARNWGVFDIGGDYLYKVFETRKEAEEYADEMTKIDEARNRWREMHRNCKTVAQEVEMTKTAEYQKLVQILFPDKKPKENEK